jgi:hypothetical protein
LIGSLVCKSNEYLANDKEKGGNLLVSALSTIAGERFTPPALSHVAWLRYNYFENFTMQSIQMGLSVIVSINTLAGCISSNKRRSEI